MDGHIFGGNMDDFKEFLRGVMNRSIEEQNMEPLGPLDPEDQKELDEVDEMLTTARDMAMEAKARKELLWIKIKRKLTKEDANRDTLRIDNGMLYGSVIEGKENGLRDKDIPPTGE